MSTSMFEESLLGDIGSFKNGVNFSKDKKCDVTDEGTLGLINVKDIFNSGRYINFHELDRVSLANQKGIEKYSVEKGDIFFVRSSVKRDGIGLVSMSPITTTEAVHCGFVIRFRLTSKSVDPLYLTYVLLSPTSRQFLVNFSGGAAITNISQTTLSQMSVQLPPFPTQHKIAAILSAYDDLIENNTKRIKILEEMAQTIYNEWFVKFRFPGHENVKMVDSELGMIPEGWRWAKLKDACDSVNYGYTASASKEPVGPKFLRITDIVPSIIEWENVPHCEIDSKNVEKYTLSEGDIVIARTGATTGYAKRLNKRHPMSVFASYLVRIRPSAVLGKYYVGIIVESEEYKVFIKQNLGGAAQPQANAQVLTSIDILMPTSDVIHAFDEVLQPMVDEKELLQIKNINLRKTRDLLLPRLISGEIDVSTLDINVEEITA